MWSADAQKKLQESDEESEEESEEEDSEEEEDNAAGPSSTAAAELSREERKKEKKARKEAAAARARQQAVQVGDLPPSDSEEESEDDMPANPNHSRQARNQTKAPATVDEATEGLAKLSTGTPSRRERETLEAAQAKERYRKLHEAGKTDEAKADLARLKAIREKREAEAARRQV
jgi:hypothetical protein